MRQLDIATIRERCRDRASTDDLYAKLEAMGLQYGDVFRGVRSLWRGEAEVIGQIALPDTEETAGYGLHPALLDAAFQVAIPLMGTTGDQAHMVFSMGRVTVHQAGVRGAWVHARSVDEGCTVTLMGDDGHVIAEVEGLHGRAVQSLQTDRRRSDGIFRLAWHEASLPSTPSISTGRWIVIGDTEILEALRSENVACRSVSIEDLADALPAENVVFAPRNDDPVEMAKDALHVLQELVQKPTRLWLVTRGATGSVSDASALGAACVWGLGRTATQEHPDVDCRRVDIGADQDLRQTLLREFASGSDKTEEVSWRGGQRFVARLERYTPPLADEPKSGGVRTDGAVLVTGGLGGLGRHVARWFATQGVRRLVLVGRRGLDTPGAAALAADLEREGATLTIAAVDVEDRAALADLVASLDVPLRGIVHAAGVLDDGMLELQTESRCERVMGPKVRGAWNLHQLSSELDLDFFVLFSSLSGTLGSAGQGPYSAANAYLDALARFRRSSGLPAVSLAWGGWSEDGMAGSLTSMQRARLERGGFKLMSATEALSLMDQALHDDEANLVLASVHVPTLAKSLGDAIPAVWRGLVRAPVKVDTRTDDRGEWVRYVSSLPPAKRIAVIEEEVRTNVARVLSMPGPKSVPPDHPLQELGLDSLMAVELRDALNKRFGKNLPATLAFDHPTPEAIAQYLADAVFELTKPQAVALAPVTRADDPIAIVSMGCRFPGGVVDPETFWSLLDGGVDAITEIPGSRWDVDRLYDPSPDAAGKMTSRWGGFLEDLDRFDPAFFGLTHREAPAVDPQLRLLLETTWEAFERAGILPASLKGTQTGVYVGMCGNEYTVRTTRHLEKIDAYALLASLHSTMVGRLSYWLGLKGPNMPIDTACSSALVAIHLACQALRDGECNLALAGGVNVLLDPASFVSFSRLRALSPTGRCHSFSADADGYVRAEGAGMIVLERLSDARRNGHPVLGLIRGTAVNQDGRSNGPTAPNGPSQEAVIRAALARAGVEPASVGYLECHGTGTPLGDPIELQAAAAAYGAGRDKTKPLLVGSVKTNIGHTEGAAGVASLIKSVLVLQNGKIPKSLHFTKPNPKIAWGELPVKVVDESVEWPSDGTPRRAALSSFGMSGTNAHIVIEEAPAVDPPAPSKPRSASLIVLSGKSEAAVKEQCRILHGYAKERPDIVLEDLSFTLATARTHHERRLAFSVDTTERLLDVLETVSAGKAPAHAAWGDTGRGDGKVAWLFTGQGSQVLGMGKALSAEWPTFRDALSDACSALDRYLDRPIRDVMWGDTTLLDETQYTQAAIFAVEWALAALWRSWGAEPDYVAGHSIGELTAACVAGLFSLEDGARLIAMRGRLMQQLAERGVMIAVAASEADVLALLKSGADDVSIAAVNSPTSVVIAGREESVRRVADHFASRGVRTKALAVSHAFHSLLMEPMLDEFLLAAESVTFNEPQIPIVSNSTGAVGDASMRDAEYWVRHVRGTVRFADGVRTLGELGVSTFVELGPKATLLGLIAESLPNAEPDLIASLPARRPEPQAILAALGAWHATGRPVLWDAVFTDGGNRTALPTYQWQRKRYWIDIDESRSGGAGHHPLVGGRIDTPSGAVCFDHELNRRTLAYLDDHRVYDHVVLPAAAYLEMAISTARQFFGCDAVELLDVAFVSALVLNDYTKVHISIQPQGDGAEFQIHSQHNGTWTLHASGRSRPCSTTAKAVLRDATAESSDVAVEDLYENFASMGLRYGSTFRNLRRVRRSDRGVASDISLNDDLDASGYHCHPALLDACIQSLAATAPDAERGDAQLPVAIASLRFLGNLERSVHCFASATAQSADIDITGDDGVQRIAISGFRTRSVSAAQIGVSKDVARDLYHVDWQPAPEAPSQITGRWLLVSDASEAEALARDLAGAGATARIVDPTALDDVAASPVEHIVYLPRPSDDTLDAIWERSQKDADVLRALVKRFQDQAPSPRLHVITQGAVAHRADAKSVRLETGLWGLARAISTEHPDLSCQRIDSSDAKPGDLLVTLGRTDDEDEFALRGDGVFVSRLVRVDSKAPVASATALDEAAVYLVSGGLGALGLHAADYLVRRGARHVVLTGRRDPSDQASKKIGHLTSQGVSVYTVKADVSDERDCESLFAFIRTLGHPLKGIVHSAGVLDDGAFVNQSWERFEGVLRPKMRGAWNLHRFSDPDPLEFFVCYSSAATVLGNAGQSNYAMANSFLDNLVAHRRSRGQTAHSIQWGSWGVGLAGELDANARRKLQKAGLRIISEETGLESLDRILERGIPEVMVLPVNWNDYAASAPLLPPRLKVLANKRVVRTDGSEAADPLFVARLREATRSDREKALQDLLQSELHLLLAMPTTEVISPRATFLDMGLDSLMAVELRNRLQKKLETKLPATLVFDYPNISNLSSHLANAIDGARDVRSPVSESPGSSPHLNTSASIRVLTDRLLGLARRPAQLSLELSQWTVRPAEERDVNSIRQLEEELYGWIGEEAVAPRELISERISILNSGTAPWFWVLERDREIIGMSVTMPTSVDPYRYTSWAEATDSGQLRGTLDPNGTAVYGVSRGVSVRAGKIPELLLTLQQLIWMRDQGKDTMFGCLAMPGFAKSGLSPEEYLAQTDENGIPRDWFLTLVANAFPGKPSFRLLIDGYPPDRDSGGHGVSTSWTFPDFDVALAEICQRIAAQEDALGLDVQSDESQHVGGALSA